MYAVECRFISIQDLIGYISMNGIDVHNLCIHVADQSVFLNDRRVILGDCYEGYNFNDLTSCQYVFERLILLFFPHNESTVCQTLADFRNSCCKMVMFIYDAAYVDIYVKDYKAALTLYVNAQNNHADNIILHENECDMRQEFYV